MALVPPTKHPGGRRCAVVGAGWAGFAAAVRAVEAGWQVELFDMAPAAGGRARTVDHQGQRRDNGQHILIGAYVRTLALMRTVGVNEASAVLRQPLALVDGDGVGLSLPAGSAIPSFVRAVMAHSQWRWREKLSLLRHALAWRISGFVCDPQLSVSQWSASLPPAIRQDLIEPLCVAALNTTAEEASAVVLLRVLRDALFAGPGSADLILPRAHLGQLLPEPALAWLQARGVTIRLSHRVQNIRPEEPGWSVDEQAFDQVVLACSAREAGRLAATVAPEWSAQALSFSYEPIVTVWLSAPEIRSPSPMVMLRGEPAQFGFDLGRLDPQRKGTMTIVISGAGRWLKASREQLEAELNRQLAQQWKTILPSGWHITDIAVEKRATFRCIPGLKRPVARIATGLWAAGDYVEGPYPATLEGAVRSGETAAAALEA